MLQDYSCSARRWSGVRSFSTVTRTGWFGGGRQLAGELRVYDAIVRLSDALVHDCICELFADCCVAD